MLLLVAGLHCGSLLVTLSTSWAYCLMAIVPVPSWLRLITTHIAYLLAGLHCGSLWMMRNTSLAYCLMAAALLVVCANARCAAMLLLAGLHCGSLLAMQSTS
jgi:hypothetical protein